MSDFLAFYLWRESRRVKVKKILEDYRDFVERNARGNLYDLAEKDEVLEKAIDQIMENISNP